MFQHAVCHSFHTKDGRLCLLDSFDQSGVDAAVALEERISSSPWTRTNFLDSAASSHICVCVKCEHNWVAHAVFSLAAGEAELLILGVAPEYQRKGLASALLNFMSVLLGERANELFLEVRASNTRAIQCYEGLGFNRLGERRNYYPSVHSPKTEREDALIYGKYIAL
jgi:ribosomal-protein-alanine N-acetyltransferase